ncbi:hypothetical protein Q7P37_008527 [Cladosporium fusiforme]
MKATLRLLSASSVTRYIDERHPITETLTHVFGGYRTKDSERRMKSLKTHDRLPGRRVEVVSEKLCDDVIKYLAPSLEPYKGCSLLIDVHPGACLWSSKLHDYLKPKRHLLMEPEMRYYDPFIKPLLEKPGSTYRHTTLTGAHAREYWDNYRKALDDPELVSDRPALDRDDPKLRKLDTDVLLTGNLWRRYDITHKTNYAEHTQLILQHMTYAAMTNEIFQRSGLVRMLWWAPDSVKSQVFATNVRSRKTFDTALTMGATVTEVAGVERLEATKLQGKEQVKRVPEMDLSVQARVEREMAARGHEMPELREQVLDTWPAHGIIDPHVQNNIFNITCKTTEDLNTLLLDVRNHMLLLQKKVLPNIKRRRINGHTPESLNRIIKDTVRHEQCYTGVMNRPQDPNLWCSPEVRTRAIVIMDLHCRIINLEANYAAVAESNPKDPSIPTFHKSITELNNYNSKMLEDFTGVSGRDSINLLLDDVISCEASPPTLERDRRPYEPLQAHSHEFWPNFDLTLLDLTPHERDLSSPGISSRVDGARDCQELLRHFLASPAVTAAAALDRLAPNGAQDLIPMAPAMSDARKGGRLDPTKVTVRMLTREMIDQLILAFLEWPFKPTRMELALARGAGEPVAVREDDGDDEDAPAEEE